MKLVVVGTYTDKEDTVLSTTTLDTRPDLPLLASTEKGTLPIVQPAGTDGEVILRVPMVSEEPVVEESETVSAEA